MFSVFYTFYSSLEHKLMSFQSAVFINLLVTASNGQPFRFLWVPELSLASDTATSGLINSKVKVKVILRPTVSRPVSPGVREPSGSVINLYFS
jgi:hypothetical protein